MRAPGEPTGQPLYALPGTWPGLVKPGNLDLLDRAAQSARDGHDIATVRSMSFNMDGHEILVPTVVNGKILSPQQAMQNYIRTGQHLGVFKSAKAANAYAEALHVQQAQLYVPPASPPDNTVQSTPFGQAAHDLLNRSSRLDHESQGGDRGWNVLSDRPAVQPNWPTRVHFNPVNRRA